MAKAPSKSPPLSGAARVAASRQRAGLRALLVQCTPGQRSAIDELAARLGISRTQAVHRAVAEAQSSSGG